MIKSKNRFGAWVQARWVRLAGLALSGAALCGAAQAQIVTPFTPVYSATQHGNMVMIGNTLMTCSTSTGTTAQLGTTGLTRDQFCAQHARVRNTNTSIPVSSQNFDNQNFKMVFVDADNAASHGFTYLNSSGATLSLPAGATVTWAGLFWQGRTSESVSARNTVRLKAPGASSYLPVTATQFSTVPIFQGAGMNNTPPYFGYADVTSMVKDAGAGVYFVGDLASENNAQDNPAPGYFGGWGLMVSYKLSSDKLRRLQVNSGAAVVGFSTPLTEAVTINIDGLRTPVAGTFDAYVGVIIGDGDMSAGSANERVLINSTPLSNGTINPATNIGNSTISDPNGFTTGRFPSYDNTLGVDYDMIHLASAETALGHDARSATVSFGGYPNPPENLYLQMLSFATEVYLPDLAIAFTKSATDINGGSLLRGDTLEYRISTTNKGLDPATNVVLTDVLPAGTTYVPNSLRIINNAGGPTGAQGDASVAPLVSISGNTLTVRLGTGATASAGGTVGIDASVTLVYQVTVNDDVAIDMPVTNSATINYSSAATEEAMAQAEATVTNNVKIINSIPTTGELALVVVALIMTLLAAGHMRRRQGKRD